MINYELLYIVNNKYSEAELKELQERVNALLGNHKSVVNSHVLLDNPRSLAYQIDGIKNTRYFVAGFETETTEMSKLHHSLRYSKDILRYILTKKPFKSAARIEKENIMKEKVLLKKRNSKKQNKTTTTENIVVDSKPNLNAEEMDVKIDQILKEDII